MNSLERELRLAAHLYYQDGNSFLSDDEFDKKCDQLRSVDPNNSIFKEPSWGYNINNDSTVGERCPHRYGLVTGLGKAYTYKEVPNQFKVRCIIGSPKLDGMSIALYYENSVLVQALTRGDYKQGIDVTDKVKLIIGDTLPTPHITGGFRGEIIMSKDSYERYESCHDNIKNARNSVAGIINSKEITEDIKYLDIVVYTILADESLRKDIVDEEGMHSYMVCTHIDYTEAYELLNKNFENVAPYFTFTGLSEDNFIDCMSHKFSELCAYYPYEVDGIVISTKRISIDRNGQFKYDEIAVKFKSETAITKVEKVDWQMSKTHFAIPVVYIQPVELDGATITKCTGLNAKYIKDNKIENGAVVEIERHGQVIPYINRVINPVSIDDVLITNCPECGEKLEWEGVHLKCMNPLCGNAILQDALIWINNIAPLDNFGDKLRIKFLQKYISGEISVESIMDCEELVKIAVLCMDEHPSPLISKQLILFSRMCNALFNKPVLASDAIKALNIPRFGDITSEKLASYPHLVKEIFSLSQAVNSDDTYVIPDNFLDELIRCIGVANGQSIINNIKKFYRLRFVYNRIVWNSSSNSAEVKGKVAITGKLSVKRSEFEKELKLAGWSVGEISKDSKFLITDNPDSSSSKNKKADEWGIPKITEYDFRFNYLKGDE